MPIWLNCNYIIHSVHKGNLLYETVYTLITYNLCISFKNMECFEVTNICLLMAIYHMEMFLNKSVSWFEPK